MKMPKKETKILFSSSEIFSYFGNLHDVRKMAEEIFDKKQNKSVKYWFESKRRDQDMTFLGKEKQLQVNLILGASCS